MSIDSALLLPGVACYLNKITASEHPVLKEIRTRNLQHRLGVMSAAPATINVLTWLARLLSARHYLEIGTFTGYSSTAMALSLPEDGTVTTCDINVTYTEYAKTAWQAANVAHKISLHLQPALITLNNLFAEGRANFFDIALIDADKLPTLHYLEACLQLVRTGGVIAIDNVLLGGRVIDTTQDSPSLTAMRHFNHKVCADKRFHAVTLPLGDGLTILLKR